MNFITKFFKLVAKWRFFLVPIVFITIGIGALLLFGFGSTDTPFIYFQF